MFNRRHGLHSLRIRNNAAVEQVQVAQVTAYRTSFFLPKDFRRIGKKRCHNTLSGTLCG